MKKSTTIFAWVLTVLLGAMFAMAGGVKLFNTPAMVQEFAQIGFGQWLRYLTGIMELGGAIGLFVPRFRFLAALDLACVMVGATLTNVFILHQMPAAGLTVFSLALILTLAWLHRPGQPPLTA